MPCPHNTKVGDNYGMTCADCGQQLEGYGNWAEGNGICIHSWFDNEDGKYEYCMYCQSERPKGDY